MSSVSCHSRLRRQVNEHTVHFRPHNFAPLLVMHRDTTYQLLLRPIYSAKSEFEGSLSHLISFLYTTSSLSHNVLMLFYLLLLLAPLCYGYFSPAPHQAALTDSDYHVENECEKVPGDNPAYYSREEAANQLFEILEFTVSPNPPIV